MPENAKNLTISLDGKTIRSTIGRYCYESPLHIISAQILELGLTLAQRSTDDKSNEIPAVQELLKKLNIKGHIIVAGALNCQKETVEIVVKREADYLLCVKDTPKTSKKILKILFRMQRYKLPIGSLVLLFFVSIALSSSSVDPLFEKELFAPDSPFCRVLAVFASVHLSMICYT